MADLRRQKKGRKLVQVFVTGAGNAWLPGFINGTIYQGQLKRLCLPGLNCYSCPGALGACPLGSLQSSLADPHLRISFYVLGFIFLLGGLLGRFVCGWLCPFGLFQELLHKIPVRKWKPERIPGLHRRLLWIKQAVLVVFVVLLPVFGMLVSGYGQPAFCTYICPSGTFMAGIPLMAANASYRELAGWLFAWKALILLAVIVTSLKIMRPFCRYLCPLGALYGYFNRISLYRIRVDSDSCNNCGACTRQCPMAVQVPEDGNTAECIRCGECAAVCPTGAIHCGFPRRRSSVQEDRPIA